MSGGNRMVRVDELLRRELAILCEQLVAPHAGALVTVAAVKTAPDLRQATVHVSIMGSEEQRQQAMRLLHACRKEMQHEIGRRVALKYTPRLTFREDHTAERADRVLAILDTLDLPDEDESPSPDPGRTATDAIGSHDAPR